MNKKYEKFITEFEGKVYTSVTAEYKRSARQSFKMNINVKEDIVFKEILRQVLKKTSIKDFDSLVEGDRIETKKAGAYVFKIVENKEFAYIYKGKDSGNFYVITFDIESTSRNYCIVTFTYQIKMVKTIAGFNGMLGNMKFKREAKSLGKVTLEKIKKACEK